jgi:hypothetical protein
MGSETRNVVLSVVLSAALAAVIAFGVATYSVQRSEDSQRREATRTRVTAVYAPLGNAVAGLIACIAPATCTDAEVRAAFQESVEASVLTNFQASDAVSYANYALQKTLRTLVVNRLTGKKQPDGLLKRASMQSIRLNDLIVAELSK